MNPPPIVLSYPAIEPDDLIDHVGFLRECGYAFVGAGELVDRWPADGAPEHGLAAICLEGGDRSQLVVGAPLLAVLGVPATHFLDPAQIGTADHLLTRDDAVELAATGAELGLQANGIPLSTARADIERLSGRRCRVLAWPGEHESARSTTAARRAGFDAAFVPEAGPWHRFAAPRLRMPGRDGLTTLARWIERHSLRARTALVGLLLELEPLDALDVVVGSF
jgi:hypothetical protein